MKVNLEVKKEMHDPEEFMEWRHKESSKLNQDEDFQASGLLWMNNAVRLNYSYMFEWLGVPVIQFPGDLLLIQEAIFSTKANKVIEIGIARGGTTLFLASILKLMGMKERTKVIGVDILISPHTREAIANSAFAEQINLIEGDSKEDSIFRKVSNYINDDDRVIVILDSNHSMDHVYEEIVLYSKLVTSGSYLIVMDTAIEFLNSEVITIDKPWGKGNNPYTAIREYMKKNEGVFVLDKKLNDRSSPGAASGGFLRKISPSNLEEK